MFPFEEVLGDLVEFISQLEDKHKKVFLALSKSGSNKGGLWNLYNVPSIAVTYVTGNPIEPVNTDIMSLFSMGNRFIAAAKEYATE